MNLFDVYPINNIIIEKAKGSRVWDDKGIEYLDMYGGHAVISIGHTHPHWVKSIEEQLEKIAFYSNSVEIPLQQQLAEKLGKLSGKHDYQLFLCNSGAEANENAMKLASFHNRRKNIIAFKNGFHGRTSLVVAATDNPAIIAPVNETNNIITLPFNDERALINLCKIHGSDISAIIIEGIQGVGGIREASVSFLQLIRKICDEYNIVFIADEIQCGYGRTGKFYATDHANVDADIYTMAKGMGNGFPIGAISISPKIKSKHGMLGTTFGGNHLACAAAIAVLEVMEKEKLMQNATKTGDYIIHELSQIDELMNARGKGLMIGFDVPEELKDLKKNILIKHHIFTGEAKPNVIRLLPSLGLQQSEADEFLKALKEEINFLHSARKNEKKLQAI